jgi:hypothetical protein
LTNISNVVRENVDLWKSVSANAVGFSSMTNDPLERDSRRMGQGHQRGAISSNINIKLDGALLVTAANKAFHTHNINQRGGSRHSFG